MRVLAPLLLVLIVALVLVSFTALSYRRQLRSLDDPVLALPRKERREHARKMLAREQAEYDLRRTEEIAEMIGEQLNRKKL